MPGGILGRPALWAFSLVVFSMIFLAAQDGFALRLTLKRIVFDKAVRADSLTVINDGAEAQTYRLRWQDMRMTETGSLVVVPEDERDPSLKSARDMVVFSPKRMTIPPGGTQQIRLMLRKKSDLPEGEYRSHLLIAPEQDVQRPAPGDETKVESKIALKMLTGASFPVIVRHGNLDIRAGFESLRLTREGGNILLNLSLTRQGSGSLYGDVVLYCPDRKEAVYALRGIAVYTDIMTRPLHLSFPAPEPSCPVLRIVYEGAKDDMSSQGKVFAEASASLP